MFDIGAGELLIIGVVALVVIGPKELPAVLRKAGQFTGKMRAMAGEFRGQFDEAMREADLQDTHKQMASLNPLNSIHAEISDLKSIVNEPVKAEPTPIIEEKPAIITVAKPIRRRVSKPKKTEV